MEKFTRFHLVRFSCNNINEYEKYNDKQEKLITAFKSLNKRNINKNEYIIANISFSYNPIMYLSVIQYQNQLFLGIYDVQNHKITFNDIDDKLLKCKSSSIELLANNFNKTKEIFNINTPVTVKYLVDKEIGKIWQQIIPFLDKVIESRNNVKIWEDINDIENHLVAEYEAIQVIKQHLEDYEYDLEYNYEGYININNEPFVLINNNELIFSEKCSDELKEIILNACKGFSESGYNIEDMSEEQNISERENDDYEK